MKKTIIHERLEKIKAVNFWVQLMSNPQTKNFIINQDKIKRELEAYKQKPKKKGGFSQRLETAMRDAQTQQAEKEANKGKKKK